MATEYETSRPGPDWWSRWLATGSLIVAAATAYWSYSQLKDLPTRDQMVAMIHKGTIGVQSEAKETIAERDQKVDQTLTGLRAEARLIFDEHQRLLQDVTTLKTRMDTDLATLEGKLDLVATASHQAPVDVADQGVGRATDSAASRAVSAAKPSAQADVPPQDNPASPPSESGAPVLVASRTTLSPVAENLKGVLPFSIHNSGEDVAEVEVVEFRPNEVMNDLPLVSLDEVLEESTTSVKVVFAPEDNKTTQSGHHGRYRTTNVEDPRILPDGSSDLCVVIHDPAHAGFGFRGELTIHYRGESDPLKIDDFPVLFVGTTAPSQP